MDKSSQAEADYAARRRQVSTLGHRYLVASTVVVKDSTGATTYDVADDYTVDAEAGVVTRVGGGAIAAADALKIAYDYADESQVTDAESNRRGA